MARRDAKKGQWRTGMSALRYFSPLATSRLWNPVAVRCFFVQSNPVCAVRHWPAFLTNFLLRSEISALVRISLDSRLCRVSIRLRPRATTGQAQLHPRLCPKPTPALDLRSFATNFVRNAGWALEWNCFAVHSIVGSFNPGYVNLSSY